MRVGFPVHRLVLLDGWRRMAAASVAGAVSALAMPPYDVWPVLFLTFPILVFLVDGAGRGRHGMRGAAATGFGFGFGYFLAGLWWIGAAFFVPGDNYQWMMPFAVLGLPLFLALFPALGLALASVLWSNGPARLLALAFGLGISEWLRGHVLTGFPWNEFGYALANNALIGQAASVVGVEGLTLIAIAVFASPAVVFDETPRRFRPVLLGAGLLAVMAAFGAARLNLAGPTSFSDVRVRIMQPDVPQDDKFRASAKDQLMARYLALSDERASPEHTGMADVDVLVWPESAFPFFLAKTPDALAQIGALLPEGAVLLTGAARIDGDGTPSASRVFNSIHALGDDGSVVATYDKVHLVPGGEFLPFQSWLEGLGIRQLTRLPGGFTAGDAPKNVVLPSGLKLGPLICYEAIFPTGVYAAERPDALLNVTNDGWFGDTPGPHQHFAQARVRAVEQGLPLIRAANTGVSAVIDAYGRTVVSMPLGESGALDSNLPRAGVPTPYALYANILLLALYLATIVGAVAPPWRV